MMRLNLPSLLSELSSVFPDNNVTSDECVDEITVYVDGIDSERIFYISLELNEDFVRILDYRIACRLRGNGLGSSVYDVFEKHIEQAGFNRIELFLVLISARKFWTKKGYLKKYAAWSKQLQQHQTTAQKTAQKPTFNHNRYSGKAIII